MKLSSKELKALGWYVKTNDLKPQLSTPPVMYFKKRETGDVVTANITGIVLEYTSWNDQEKKIRAKEKRVNDTRSLLRRTML